MRTSQLDSDAESDADQACDDMRRRGTALRLSDDAFCKRGLTELGDIGFQGHQDRKHFLHLFGSSR